MRLSSSVMAVGGAVLAAGLIGFTNPKAVHALAAALVQVTNTAANPVVTQGVGPQAQQIVHLHCGLGIAGPIPFSNAYWCGLRDPSTGPAADAYVVPANESLVVTSVDIAPIEGEYSLACASLHGDRLNATKDAAAPQDWTVSNVGAHYTYPSGIVFGPGSSMYTSQSVFTGTPQVCSQGNDNFDLYGYLTPA